MNFRRDHFATAERPLSFSLQSRKPGIVGNLMMWECVRELELDMRKRNLLMMANWTPHNFFWLMPLLDFPGTETDWNKGGTWSPPSDEYMLRCRSLSKGKPYGFIMNTNFDKLGTAAVEKYMKRSLAYGMMPGFFSADAMNNHYFDQPALYNRDRPHFKKYIPLVRLVSEAGWEPLTGVKSDNPQVIVERYGTKYLTVFNLSDQPQKVTITLTKFPQPASCNELVHGGTVVWQNKTATFEIGPEDVRLLEMK